MMKMISQKHTSKFVAGFLQGLGLVACVSFTSCGDKDSADKQKRESLRNSLKDLNLDGEKKEKIVNYCIENKAELKGLKRENLENLGLDGNEINGFLAKYGSTNPEEKKVSVKFEDKKATVGGKDFDFDSLDSLKNFVAELKKNKNVEVEGNGSFNYKLNGTRISVCGGSNIDFDEDLVAVFDSLRSCGDFFRGFNLNINGSKEVCFGQDKVDVDFAKGENFWKLVKGCPVVFGIADDNSKLEIKKCGQNDVNVCINGFESSLEWKSVAVSDKDFVKDSGWDKIFKLKA